MEATVFEVIAGQIKRQPEDVSLDMRLDELGIDSLEAITILYELEERYEIEIPNEVFESIKTVGDIVYQLNRILADSSPARHNG
ncbi:MAG: acyl carrier protein [Pseudomonadota bacterium]|nr:acyl carrier protein [Pseudomonadota bacterium]